MPANANSLRLNFISTPRSETIFCQISFRFSFLFIFLMSTLVFFFFEIDVTIRKSWSGDKEKYNNRGSTKRIRALL